MWREEPRNCDISDWNLHHEHAWWNMSGNWKLWKRHMFETNLAADQLFQKTVKMWVSLRKYRWYTVDERQPFACFFWKQGQRKTNKLRLGIEPERTRLLGAFTLTRLSAAAHLQETKTVRIQACKTGRLITNAGVTLFLTWWAQIYNKSITWPLGFFEAVFILTSLLEAAEKQTNQLVHPGKGCSLCFINYSP